MELLEKKGEKIYPISRQWTDGRGRMFPRRDVFVILDVIISFRDGERAEPHRLEVKTGIAHSKPRGLWVLHGTIVVVY